MGLFDMFKKKAEPAAAAAPASISASAGVTHGDGHLPSQGA